MRGEILSSVELVLPPNVVETCYNIKRDVQARFRAVNDEEKTKSEITVEKQTDDSVRIHVVVISVKCLSTEELEEENTYLETLDESEHVKNKPLRGRVRRKARKWTKKKSAKIIRRVAAISDNPKVSEEDNTVKEESFKDHVESTPLSQVINGQNSNEEGGGGDTNDESENTALPSSENTNSETVQTSSSKTDLLVASKGRTGRGRGRGRYRGRGRGARRRVAPVNNDTVDPKVDKQIEEEQVSHIPDEPLVENTINLKPGTKQGDSGLQNQEATTSEIDPCDASIKRNPTPFNERQRRSRKDTESSTASRTGTKHEGSDLQTQEGTDPQTQETTTSEIDQSEASLAKDLTSLNERPRRTRRDTESSTACKIIKPKLQKKSNRSIKKAPVVKAKLPGVSAKEKKSPKTVKGRLTKTKSDEGSRESKGDLKDAGEGEVEVPNVRASLRKRKPKPVESDSNILHANQDTPLSSELSKSDSPVEPGTAPRREDNVENIPDHNKDPADGNLHCLDHGDLSARHDNISIQDQTVDDGEKKATEPCPENVKPPQRYVRKRGKSKSAPGVDTSDRENPANHNVVGDPKDAPETQPFQRVKTKAQLKQKPSELSDIDHAETEIQQCIRKRSKSPELPDDSPTPSKSPLKKPPTKPRTLSRIWRTRKKSGFTHRKKSRPKNPAINETAILPGDIETDKQRGTLLENPDELKQDLDIINGGNTDVGNNCVNQSNSDEYEKLPSNIKNSSDNTQEYNGLSTHHASDNQNIDDLKLPQKKRHISKLAAEKSHSISSQNHQLEENKSIAELDRTTPHSVSNRILEPVTDLMTEEEFNETSAIESLIRLSNATEESLNVPPVGGNTPRSDHRSDNSESQATPVDTSTDEIKAAIQSISGGGSASGDESTSCEIPMPTSNETIQHLMKIAVGDNKSSPPEERPVKRAYKREFKVQCRFCNVKVKDYGYLFRHVKKLHRDKGTEMLRHLEEIRPLMRTPCPICHKMVSSISNISSHIKQCHASKDSAVLCPICKKTYKTSVSLRQHLRQCHQPQQHRFFCHMCSANFTEKRSLKEHINCSHETTQIFQCDECGKSFLTKGRLRRHKYIHGEFRHKCRYCDKGFHLKDNMNKHIEIVHEKTQGKRFECPHCEKKFTVKGNMTQHIMGVHLKQFQYTCPQCQTGFRRKKDMLSHMVKHGESGSVSGDSNTNNRSNCEEEENEDSPSDPLDNTWHGSGEKTEVITGLATEGEDAKCNGPPRKTQLIVITPKEDKIE